MSLFGWPYFPPRQQRLVHQNQGLVGIAIGEVNIGLKSNKKHHEQAARPQLGMLVVSKVVRSKFIWISLRICDDDGDGDGDDDDDDDDDGDDDDDDDDSCYHFSLS